MLYRKFFFPIGGGEELRERISGALLVAEYFKVHLEILKSNPGIKPFVIPADMTKDIMDILKKSHDEENQEFMALLEKVAKEHNVTMTEKPIEGQCTVHALIQSGDRSQMVQEEAKYCDLVVAAAPPGGEPTKTFEATVLHSGKSVLVIPRVLTSFNPKSIIVGWNNSQEASRALTSSIEILKAAERVHVISGKLHDEDEKTFERIRDYLAVHGITCTTEFIKPTMIAGETLLKKANEGKFDLIVAGAYSHRGLKELMFGGSTKYLLTHSTIPIFMSH